MTTARSNLLNATFLAALCCGPACGQATQQTPAQMAESMVKADRAWSEKLNTGGAILTLVETARTNGRISFRLHAEGLPAGHVYSLLQWPITQRQPVVALPGVTMNAAGIAVCAGKPGTCGDASKPDDPIDLQTAPAQGEPLRFALVAQDDPNLRAAVKLVPIPNSGADRGCRVEAVRLTPHAELISVEASGFPANTEVNIIQNSEGEQQDGRRKTDETGKIVWAVLPVKAGSQSGSITIQVKASGCSPQVSVAWGTPPK